MKKLTIFLLVGIALSLSIISCSAETLQQATDVFKVTDDGRKMQIVIVLDEGTEYEVMEQLTTQAGSAFDSYFFSNVPIEWTRISYRDRNGITQQGWIVANPDMIIGINMSVFDGDSSEEYNGYDTGFVVCESLSLREMPDVTSNINHTLTYGANCTVIEENGSWYNIVYRDEEGKRYSGWVRKEYVLINSNYFTPKASFIIGGSGVDALYFITVSEDDQIVMSGLTQSSDGTLGSRTKDGPCGWVTCINNNGNVLWNFCRHTAKYEFMEAPAFLPDGRITVIYRTEQNGIGKLELITLSCDGEMLSIRPLLEAGNKMIHFTVYDFDPENGYVIIEMNKKTGTDRWMLYSQEGEYICDITPYDRVENDNVAVMKDGTRISLKSIEQNNGDMLVTFEEPNVEPAGVFVR